MYGTVPKPVPTVTTTSNLLAVKSRLEFLDKIWQEVAAAHKLAAKWMIAHRLSQLPILKENNLACVGVAFGLSA